MNLQLPVKCTKKLQENGHFSMTLVLPPDVPGRDRIMFTGLKEMTYYTDNKSISNEVNTEDTLYLNLTSKQY